MEVFVDAFSAISPFSSVSNETFSPEVDDKNCLICIEPDYKSIIDKKYIRRMSRILKMSVANALKCVEDSSIKQPDAIITATGLGCITDTADFLHQVTENGETLLNPTAFIQSTHNTPSGLIAQILNCKCPNFTFSQEDTSFESALLQSIMMIESAEYKNVLTGSMDELTNELLTLLQKTQCFSIYRERSYFPGEGSAFFMLSDTASTKNIAKIEDVFFFETSNSPAHDELIIKQLIKSECKPEHIRMVLTGSNLNKSDWFQELYPTTLQPDQIIHYKKYCGEYNTSISFALYLALLIISQNDHKLIPEINSNINVNDKILIHNEKDGRHSLILISKC